MKRFLFCILAVFALCGVSGRASAQTGIDTTKVIRIGEVLVLGGRIDKEVIPAQILAGEELQRLSVVSVADAIRYFSGAQIKDYGGIGGLKTVNIRSMGTQHVGVFYDGVQLGNAQNGQIDLGRFSMDNMEAISLYNGQKSNIFQSAKDFASAGSVYMQTRRPEFEEGKDIAMKELTEEFIRQFDIYLRTEVGLRQSSVWMYTFPLKTIVSRAHCNGHIHRNPFAQYRIRPNVRERQFLTEEELQTMMNHRLSDPSLVKVRDIFVFDCLTGISFSDTRNLTTDNLENTSGGWWIASKRQKTGVPFRVKLLDSALRIIERYEPFRRGNHLFDLCGNTDANNRLRKIVKECGIEKQISWHCSRHTFGTLALSKGMPIESASKILGHTNITTTQIYAKITTEKLERDISAFGEKLEAGLTTKASAPTIIAMPTASQRSSRSRTEAAN